jgi:nitrous oxide reductase accessory protein NosL
MKHLLVIVLLVVFLFTAGCGNKSQDTVVTPSGVTTNVPVITTTNNQNGDHDNPGHCSNPRSDS